MNKRWAVFISGQGSNLRAILQSPELAKVVLVVSSKKSAYGLVRARRLGIPTMILPKLVDWEVLDTRLRDAGVERIFLAGFMKIIPQSFVEKWPHKMLNLHPSLLPKYPGLHSIERAYSDGEAIGVTVHEVIPELDAGPIVLQKKLIEADQVRLKNLEECELITHIGEQRIVREALKKWR